MPDETAHSAESDAERSKRTASEVNVAENEEAAKRTLLTASKIHGVAPVRKPRVGSQYQATIPPLQTAGPAAQQQPAHLQQLLHTGGTAQQQNVAQQQSGSQHHAAQQGGP